MSADFLLPKAYEPKVTDKKWYTFWEKGGFFHADPESTKPPFCLVIPPPNVTGVLHMGHALVNTLQDILVRWKRMSGFETLWVPGTDHAGIATQAAVERHLLATLGKRRFEFTREEFMGHVWEWKERHENIILSQLKSLGSSFDIARLRFTMDEGCNSAVRLMFKKLFDQGLIYRGDYLVNWDPVTQTALADDEVEYEEHEGHLWYFRYPLEDNSSSIVIATTRPETMLGDVAVAVAPKDERYSHLIGKKLRHPLTEQLIPIVADHFVDPTFGTGAVKITPAHDSNDYELSFRHDLPLINILTPDGKINEKGGAFTGLPKEHARIAIVEKMRDLNLLEKIEPYRTRIGVSYRSHAVIEPYLSKQWFVKMSPFKDTLKEIVKEKRVALHPALWEHTYFHWVDHLRDWCISRQLWWGHRIPVWYKKDDPSQMLCYEGEGIPPQIAAEKDAWQQDEDVLDTWFSAGLWPFSALGWPQNTAELKKFYPNSVLITGHDILFFWVARMIFMGECAFHLPPFPQVFLHGLIYGKSYWRKHPEGGITYVTGEEKKEYDKGKALPPDVHSKWEKLSKSKGNVIDPLDMIDTYGTDAVRMTLASLANQTPQIDLDERRFEEFKNFANKIWNGARFVFMHLNDLTSESLASGIETELLTLEDRWILSLIDKRTQEVNEALSTFAFDKAASLAYTFFWNEFCAYYLEIVKPCLYGKVGSPLLRTNKQKLLTILLCKAIRLLHPMAPFITEELFQLLKARFPILTHNPSADPHTTEMLLALAAPSCAVAPYPSTLALAPAHDFALLEKIVYALRNIRGEMGIPPQTPTDLFISPPTPLLASNLHIISALIPTGTITLTATLPTLSTFSAQTTIDTYTLLIPLPHDLQEKEKTRLHKELEKLLKLQQNARTLLANTEFLLKASPDIKAKQQETLLQTQKELCAIQDKLKTLGFQ